MWQRTMPNFATSDGGVLRLRVAGLLLEVLNVGAKSNFISYNLCILKQISLSLKQVFGIFYYSYCPPTLKNINIEDNAELKKISNIYQPTVLASCEYHQMLLPYSYR